MIDIAKLTPEEFKARLEKYKNHDIAIALRELDEFSKFVENQGDRLDNTVGPPS